MANKRKSEVDYSKVKIIHTLADGTVVDSIEGYVIPYNDDTKIVYQLLNEWASVDVQNKENQ